MTRICLFVSTLLLSALLICNVPMDRAERVDRDLGQFTSAINGALRLRYGKRFYNPAIFVPSQEVGNKYLGPFDDTVEIPIEKQAVIDALVKAINEAEPLRYG
ncbi:Queuine tRNA-ribosyltransferase [Dirofilaria immitis]